MIRKMLLFVGLIAIDVLYSQFIGINNPNPQRTLDVEGTVRLKTPGDFTVTSKPLALHKETKEIIVLDVNQGEPFLVKRVTFPYKNGINRVDLGYSTADYEIAIVGAAIVDNSGRPPVMKVYSISDKNSYFPGGLVNTIGGADHDNRLEAVRFFYRRNIGETFLRMESGNYLLQGNTAGGLDAPQVGQYNFLSYAPPKFRIEKKPGKTNWHFEGGYDFVGPIDRVGRLSWQLDILVIHKHWVKKTETVKVRVGRDHKTLTKVSGTHPIK